MLEVLKLENELFRLKNNLFFIYTNNLARFLEKLEDMEMHKEIVEIYRILKNEQTLTFKASQAINTLLERRLSE